MNRPAPPAPPAPAREPRQNRSLDALHPEFRRRFDHWRAAAERKGFRILVVETHRTPERQAWLFALGRTRPGRVVTWTMDSLHRYRLAVDIVPLTADGQADWSLEAYDRLYRAVPPGWHRMELLAFERPHLQIRGGHRTAAELGIRIDAPLRGGSS